MRQFFGGTSGYGSCHANERWRRGVDQSTTAPTRTAVMFWLVRDFIHMRNQWYSRLLAYVLPNADTILGTTLPTWNCDL
eukprot:1973561-Amphidinium_carterae.1